MYPMPIGGLGLGAGGQLAMTGFPVALYLSVSASLVVSGLLFKRAGRIRAAGVLGPLRA